MFKKIILYLISLIFVWKLGFRQELELYYDLLDSKQIEVNTVQVIWFYFWLFTLTNVVALLFYSLIYIIFITDADTEK